MSARGPEEQSLDWMMTPRQERIFSVMLTLSNLLISLQLRIATSMPSIEDAALRTHGIVVGVLDS